MSKKLLCLASALFLTGCMKIEVTEKLSANGTSLYEFQQTVEIPEGEETAALNLSNSDADMCDEIDLDDQGGILLKCEEIGPGSAKATLRRYDFDEHFVFNADGTTTFYINDTDTRDSESSESDSAQARSMGIEATYKIISPWKIISHSSGARVDEFTVVFDLTSPDYTGDANIVLDTKGTRIPVLSSSVESKLDNMAANLKSKLSQSDAPNERKVAYLDEIDRKLEMLVSSQPDKAVIISHLQSSLRTVKEEFPSINTAWLNAQARKSSFILKTARAVDSITSFELNNDQLKEVLKNEGGYDIEPDTMWYAYDLSGNEFATFSCDGTNLLIDGTTAAVNAMKEAQVCESNNPQVNGYNLYMAR